MILSTRGSAFQIISEEISYVKDAVEQAESRNSRNIHPLRIDLRACMSVCDLDLVRPWHLPTQTKTLAQSPQIATKESYHQ